MRVQTYASWQHQHATPRAAGDAPQPLDDLSSIINDLIAQVAYYPSFVVHIRPDARGLLIAGAQRVIEAEEQLDGMVVLRTQESKVFITHADYHRLVA
jgi:hypothetical protein